MNNQLPTRGRGWYGDSKGHARAGKLGGKKRKENAEKKKQEHASA